MTNVITNVRHTWLHVLFRDDVTFDFGNVLPYPQAHYIKNNYIVYCWLVDGFFDTKKGSDYLNDIIARFKLTYDCKLVNRINYHSNDINPVKLTQFRHLTSKVNSILNAKYKRAETYKDFVFWCLKLHAEELIKKEGLIIYQTLETFALDNFIDHAKDKSTLIAKCRAVYNWYFERNWQVGRAKKKYLNMKDYQERNLATRQEQAKKMHTKLAAETKRKILNCVTGMFSQDYKKNNGDWNISKIAKDTGTSRTTVYKYINDL